MTIKYDILFPLNYNFVARLLLIFLLISCDASIQNKEHQTSKKIDATLIVLGNVQDGGSPHIGCQKECCADLFEKRDPNRMVVSLGLIDYADKKTFLFEATPDITRQLEMLQSTAEFNDNTTPDGIFITHAHIGHYTGLMYLGREALGGNAVPIYVMPRMQSFLSSNGPWDQLIKLNNIKIHPLQSNQSIGISKQLKVTPLAVPHRDEYSETVGFVIHGPAKSALFIPDINKWHMWDQDIIEEIKKVDFAFLDATFYDQKEIPQRDMSEIPHPFVEESIKLFETLPASERDKIYFIHLNHSNPLLRSSSAQSKHLEHIGFHVARFGQQFNL